MKKRYFIFLIGILVIWICAAMSNRIENVSIPAVKFVEPQSGYIEFSIMVESTLTSDTNIRVRSAADLIIEDVYIQPGDFVGAGDKIATVYDKSLNEAIQDGDEITRKYLQTIKDNSYSMISDMDMYITQVNITEDSQILKDTILYKYAPTTASDFSAQFFVDRVYLEFFQIGDVVEYTYNKVYENGENRIFSGNATISSINENILVCSFEDEEYLVHGDKICLNLKYKSEKYDTIIPYTALEEMESTRYTDTYSIFYAIPDIETEDRWIVVKSTVVVLDTNGVEAAIEFNYSDDRKIVSYSEENIFDKCVIREKIG